MSNRHTHQLTRLQIYSFSFIPFLLLFFSFFLPFFSTLHVVVLILIITVGKSNQTKVFRKRGTRHRSGIHKSDDDARPDLLPVPISRRGPLKSHFNYVRTRLTELSALHTARRKILIVIYIKSNKNESGLEEKKPIRLRYAYDIL